MRSKRLVYEHNASMKEYLSALVCYPHFTRLLNTRDKPYEKIFQWLVEKQAYLKEDNSSWPTMKEISQELKISSSKIVLYLKAMYDEIIELNSNSPDLFKKEGQILCLLSFNYFGAHASFSIGLDIIPREGDYLDFFFIRPKLGRDGFYVKKIYHNLEESQSIAITLVPTIPNTYYQLLKEKAYLRKEITLMELMNLNDDTEFVEKFMRSRTSL